MATSLELYVVRHGLAAARGPKYPDDRERPLTAEGVARFRRSVRGLARLGVRIDLVATSPLVRARQTADLLVAGLRPAPRLEVVEPLAPGGSERKVLAAIAELASKTPRLALVGHEPDLSQLVARLVQARGAVEMKKGAVALIELDAAMPQGPGTLRFLLPPSVLRRLGR